MVFELECSEPAIGEPNLPANSGRSSIPEGRYPNDSCTLKPAGRPIHTPRPQRSFEVRRLSDRSGRHTCRWLAIPSNGSFQLPPMSVPRPFRAWAIGVIDNRFRTLSGLFAGGLPPFVRHPTYGRGDPADIGSVLPPFPGSAIGVISNRTDISDTTRLRHTFRKARNFHA